MFAAGAIALAFAVPTSSSQVMTEKCHASVKFHNETARIFIHFSDHNGDYRAGRITRKHMAYLGHLRGCATSTAAHSAMLHYFHVRMRAWRFYRHIDLITPYGKWAIDPAIVQRESHGTRCVINGQGSDAGGYYQILNSTWTGGGGRPIARRTRSYADCAPAWEQHEVAARLWAGGKGRYTHWKFTAR